MSVVVVTDSVASVPGARATELGVEVVDLYVNDGETNTADREIDLDRFYERLADSKSLPTSSQPSVESLVSVFERAIDRGSDVVGVFISAKMSGTSETAVMAAEMVKASRPNARIAVVDSGSNSLQEGYCALSAASSALAGGTLEECVAAALATARRTRYLFTPSSLENLRRGGRIGNASALLGQLLQIRPILTVENGVVTTFAKVRTQAKALTEITRAFKEEIDQLGLARAVVHFIGDSAPAQRFATEQIAPLAGMDIEVVPVSAVIGVHVGPAVGLVYETKEDIPGRAESAQLLLSL